MCNDYRSKVINRPDRARQVAAWKSSLGRHYVRSPERFSFGIYKCLYRLQDRGGRPNPDCVDIRRFSTRVPDWVTRGAFVPIAPSRSGLSYFTTRVPLYARNRDECATNHNRSAVTY